jgi:glycosyltransferase involved in cell wall biosynthesis
MNVQNNICFFNTTPFWGGGEKLHLEYALEFKKLNYNVCVVAKKDSPFFQESKQEGIEVSSFTVKTFSFLNRKKALEVRRFFKDNKINTVFISASPDLKIAAFAAKKAGVKNIIYLRGLAVSIKNTPLNRVLLTKTITHIIANSEETKRQMVKNFRDPVLEKKVKVIYHGIDLDLFDKKYNQTSPLYVKKDGEFVIGNAGRLTKQKGQYFLIEIAKKLKEKRKKFKILIAGAGEEEEALKQLIRVNNLEDHVILLGFVKNIEGFMKSLDVFALTSIWEGFGYVIVEAMAAKKAVVAFDITSNPEIITQNETGFLIPQKNVIEFSEKIDLLLNNTKLSYNMGADGRNKAEERFQLKTIILEIEAYLQLKEKL